MYSEEHRLFVKKQKQRAFWIRFFQVFILILFLIIWQLLANFHVINTFISSSPARIYNTFIGLLKANNLLHHVWVTLYETLLSFGIGTLLGCFIAAILWWNPFLAKVVDPYLTILNSLPKVALGPIIIIWFGAGMKSIIIMALLISVIITIINVHQSFQDTDENKIKLMQSFHANKRQTFFKLILPSNYSTIISAFKINISMSFIGVIMGEFLVSKEGIGYLIMYGSQVFNLDLVMFGIILLCFLSAILYYIILYFERKMKKGK